MSSFRRRLMMAQRSGSLPAGYTQVDFIRSVKDLAYINTGYVPNINTEFEIVFQQEYLTQSYPTVYGTRNEGTGTQRFYTHTMDTFYVVNVGDGGTSNTNYTWYDRHSLKASAQNVYFDDEAVSFTEPTDINPTNPLLFFAYNNIGSIAGYFCGKVMSVVIKENNIKLHDFVPCYNSSNIYGFYDIVAQNFLTSPNTGVFSGKLQCSLDTSSPVLPSGYTRCNYIKNPNSAYIDTGILPNGYYTIVTDIEMTENTGGYQFIGSSGSPCGLAVTSDMKLQSIIKNNWKDGGSALQIGTRYRVEMTNLGTVYTDKSKAIAAHGNSTTASQTFALFVWSDRTASSTANRGLMKMYGFAMYSDTGALLCDYQPAVRDSDGEYGMWDYVSQTFLTSPNGVSFTGG